MSQTHDFDPYAMSPLDIQEPPESLWQALKKIGPGIILAGSIVGSGELILTTSLGAEYGFTFLWLILLSCVIKVFVQIELGRYAISSGKPTLGAINELPGVKILGAHWILWWWALMLLSSVLQLGGMNGLIAKAMHLAFPGAGVAFAGMFATNTWLGQTLSAHPEYPWSVFTALCVIGLLLSGGYGLTEKVTTFLVVSVTAVTVLCVLVLPFSGFPITWEHLVEGFSFKLPSGEGIDTAIAVAAAFSCFGITGVGAAELFSYPYWCLEKGYARYAGPRTNDEAWARRANGWMRVLHLDAWASMLVFTLATVAFYILGATVLHEQGLHPKNDNMIETLSQMYVPSFGSWTRRVFLVAAWAVLFKTLYVATAGHARLTADFFSLAGWTRYADASVRKVMIRGLCVFYPLLALTFYLWLAVPKTMVTFGGVAQALTLPVISGATIFLRYFRTDKRITPSTPFDICLWLASIGMTVVAAQTLWTWIEGLTMTK